MARSPSVSHIRADALRRLRDDTPEHDIVLVDVREPEEYAAGHLPGALLMPLLDLQTQVRRIPAVPIIVFYCRSGARSARAALFAAMELGRPVHNLAGGMLEWSGLTLPDMPALRVFQLGGGLPDLLRSAMDLEKGAHRAYVAMMPFLAGSAAEPAVRGLLAAERDHAEALYDMLALVDPAVAPEDFERVFAELPGTMLESGASFEAVAEALSHVGADRVALLELALEMELRAYDLYRSAANVSQQETQRSALLDLAEQERGHATLLARAIGAVASRPAETGPGRR